MLKPFDYQIDIAERAYKILCEHCIVYLAMEERTGKSLTSLLIAEKCRNVTSVLIVTKKKALEGWVETLAQFTGKLDYTLINYESLHKLDSSKRFGLVIVDESHYAISGYPRPSKTFNQLRSITYNMPVIYLSATPSAESFCQLYHQFAITQFSPFKGYRNFYDWFRVYGIPNPQFIGGRNIEKYNLCQIKKVVDAVSHLFISFTREELGFTQEPVDKVVWINLKDSTIKRIKDLEKLKVLHEYAYSAENPAKELQALHQLEGGTLKLSDSTSIETGSVEKIQYILDKYGDTTDVAIMYNYVAEGKLLRKYFNNAAVLQATSYAEGVDLSHVKHLIIYSMSFSASKFIQRRARQCNIHRSDPIVVEYLICKDCISEMVYNAIVHDKMSFTLSYYSKHKSGGKAGRAN